MPCRHGEHDNGDEEAPMRSCLIGQARDPRHHASQEDPWPCEEEKTTSMLELPAAVSLPSTDAVPAEILLCTYLPGGEQESEPTALGTQAGKPRLLLRCAARKSSAGVAREAPGIRARIASKGPPVTRDDNRAAR